MSESNGKAMKERRQAGSFFQIDRAALEVLQTLPRPAIVVYLRLCSRSNSWGECWPSIRTIAEDVLGPLDKTPYKNLDEETAREAIRKAEKDRGRIIYRAIREIREAGLIEVKSGRGCKESNTYFIPRILTQVSPFNTDPPVSIPPENADTGVTGILTQVSPNTDTGVTSNTDTGVSQNEKNRNENQEREPLNEKRAADAACVSDQPIDWFSLFWEAYPRKVAKRDAIKAFANAIKTASPAEIVSKAIEFAQSPKGQSGQYCPHPATWLNGERWKDDPETWNIQTNKSFLGGSRVTAGSVYDPDAAKRNPKHGVV